MPSLPVPVKTGRGGKEAVMAYGYFEADFVAARYGPDELVLASPARRLAATIIDSILFGLPWAFAWVGFWIWLLGLVTFSDGLSVRACCCYSDQFCSG